jgi:hypothetical protein
MQAVTIELDEETLAKLTARGLPNGGLSEAVREAVWFACGDDPNVLIDHEIAAEFNQTRIGVTGDEVIGYLHSLGTANPLDVPKPHHIARK